MWNFGCGAIKLAIYCILGKNNLGYDLAIKNSQIYIVGGIYADNYDLSIINYIDDCEPCVEGLTSQYAYGLYKTSKNNFLFSHKNKY